tara:strand:+ start:206 stop:421 length:216 start_codon:yes stop_codon:yes gene_type:complete
VQEVTITNARTNLPTHGMSNAVTIDSQKKNVEPVEVKHAPRCFMKAKVSIIASVQDQQNKRADYKLTTMKR